MIGSNANDLMIQTALTFENFITVVAVLGFCFGIYNLVVGVLKRLSGGFDGDEW